ncbi:MAG: 16S rRNA (cytidine(1402)-2'-O)-methyltransferase [Clostridia bacterium]|nr:16S rRNA (cytidine(1402)-2'-O)-methyltransferase [Clostridia bacterium]
MVYFVATPIGNLRDMTMRAVDVLKAADVIYCEDTRHSMTLLGAYGIKKPLKPYHKFNEKKECAEILKKAAEGKEIAVVSDAGMPLISDPGSVLVRALREEDLPYTVIPGPCAFVTALVLAGFPTEKCAFVGFLPEKAGERKAFLEKYKSLDLTLCVYSAPQDIDRDISSLYEVFGERSACAVREMTKIHEEAVPFMLSEGLPGEKRGEYTLVIEGARGENPLNLLSVREHVEWYMEGGMDKKSAVKETAKDRGVPKNEVYKEVMDIMG